MVGEMLEPLLAASVGLIGFLLSLLIALVAYVFISLRGEVRELAEEISELHDKRARLVHRDDCRITIDRIHDRLDEQDASIHQLHQRVARTETLLEKHC